MDATYVESLSKEFERNGFGEILSKPKFIRLMYLYVYYHYLSADSSKIDELLDGDLTLKEESDNIDGLYVDELSDDRNIDILISVPSDDPDTDFKGFFAQAEKTYFEALDRNIGRPSLLQKLKDPDFRASRLRPLVIYVLTDLKPKFKDRARIENAVSKLKSDKDFVSYRIIFSNDIEGEILEIEDPKESVEHGSLVINKGDDILTYKGSIIVNASAKSIQSLYQQYANRGLFAQNLRYYVKNAKIDSAIVDSIQNRFDDFWYFNNGIILICKEFRINGNEIELEDFSIINGGQTTYLIGETPFDNDFFLQCKIILADKDKDISFISDVAEASNTQKPIKMKDLIANRKEQRMLKSQLSKAGIFCSVKRGQKINKKVYTEAWQNTNNEEISQFLYSYLYQSPCTARNSKASLISNTDRYNLIFGKTYPDGFLIDLLKMKVFYKAWLKKVTKDPSSDATKIGLGKNGMLLMYGLVGLLSKLCYHRDYFSRYSNGDSLEKKKELFSQYDIFHPFMKKELSLNKDSWFELFDYCYENIFAPGFAYLRNFKPNYTSYSNFTKTQKNYDSCVLGNYLYQLKLNGSLPLGLLDLFNRIFYVPSEEERQEDNLLLSKYVNMESTSFLESSISASLQSNIEESLIHFRTWEYKIKHVKAYEVFTNKQAKKISMYGASSLDELRALKVLSEEQILLYGEGILKAIKEAKEKEMDE